MNALTYRSFSHTEIKDHQKALKDANDAVTIDGANNEALLAKGIALINLNNLIEGCKAVKKAQELGNEDAKNHMEKCK